MQRSGDATGRPALVDVTGRPAMVDVTVPGGHCLVNLKWRGSGLAAKIEQVMKVQLMDDMGPVDFRPSQTNLVVFLSEADVACGIESVQRTLARLYKFAFKDPRLGLVPTLIFHSSELTNVYLAEIQQLAVRQFGIPLIPVHSQDQIPQLLYEHYTASRERIPFRTEDRTSCNLGREALLLLQSVPGLNEKKARQLLHKFGSISATVKAPKAELEAVIGQISARRVQDFFSGGKG